MHFRNRSWLVEEFAGETNFLREGPQGPQAGGGGEKEVRGRGVWIVRILCGEVLVGFSTSGGTAAITTLYTRTSWRFPARDAPR